MAKRTLLHISLVAAILFLSLAERIPARAQSGSAILYVRASGTGSASCANWAAACSLTRALELAERGDEIRVAAGTYLPTTGSSRSATFELVSGAAIYGGFPSSGGSWAQRDAQVNLTVLSGDIGQPGNAGDNSYHVVSSAATHPQTPTILDGFLITGGNANGSGENGYGGGIYNSGGSPQLANLLITANSAVELGGGMYNRNGDPALTNVVFTGNTIDCATDCSGGAIYNRHSSPALVNVTLYANRIDCADGGCSGSGGALSSRENSQPTLANCIVWGNLAPLAAQIDGDATVTYSDVQGGWSGTGNLDADPLFIDAPGGNLRLQSASPAIDAGSNAALPAGVEVDFDGSPRIVDYPPGGGAVVDMGAYEVQAGTARIYVDADSAGPVHNGASWATAFTTLTAALSAAQGTHEVWVAEGTYYPGLLGNRAATFHLKSGVAIYGGFAGTESDRSQRLPGNHFTLLSGDLNRDRLVDEDAYHVVTGSGVDATAILDGFTIMMGFANAENDDSGGGILNLGGSPTLANLHINNNRAMNGGGMYNEGIAGSAPTLTNVTFSYNRAATGGGMFNTGSSPALVSLTFSSNEATARGGGLHNAAGSHPALTNVTVSGNQAGIAGGGIFSDDTSGVTLVNGVVWNNSAGEDPQIAGAAAVDYSDILIEGGGVWAGQGNINEDPQFSPLGAYSGVALTHALRAGSPAIDAGSPEVCPATEGWPRPMDGDRDGEKRCDMGMYEFPPYWVYLPEVLR